MNDADLEAVLTTVRSFVRDVVIPLEAQIEERDEIPEHVRQATKDMGLWGFALAEEFGGLGLTMVQEAQVVFELGYTTPSLRSMFGTNNGIAGHVLQEGGSPEQKEKWLPLIASGDVTASFGLTEADAGSDPSTLTTSAVPVDGGWRIDGSKRYITNSPTADVIFVFARTDPDPTARHAISCFLVPASTPGVTVGPRDHKMGQAGSWSADVHLDDVRVPADSLVGGDAGLGHGLETAMRCLAHGRIHIAALCVGMAQRLVDESVGYASERKQSGQLIGSFQLVQGMLADSVTDLYAGRSLVLDSARAYDAGTDRRIAPSAAKYFASEMVSRVADRAVQIHGGAGYIRGVPVERMYRDARLFRIYEGTSQIQQIIIARGVLAAARR